MFQNKIFPNAPLFLLLLVCLNSSCKSQGKFADRGHIKGLRLITTLPHPDQNDGIVYTNPELLLMEYGDLRVFQIPVTHHFTRTNVDKKGDYLSEQYLGSETSHRYVVFREGNKTGMSYDSLTDNTGTALSVDSFLMNSSILYLGQLYSKKRINDSLISSAWAKDSATLTEYYIPKQKRDESYSDSTILRYDRSLQGFAFSLSAEIDSIKGIKLRQLSMIYNTNEKAQLPFARNARKITFEIVETAITNEKQLAALIALYKKETGIDSLNERP